MAPEAEAGRLSSRYRRLVTLVGATVVVILALLIAREFENQVARDLELSATIARERLSAIETVVRIADAHVDGLRAAMERSLGAGAPPRDPRPGAVALRTEAAPVDLLGAPKAADAHRLGTLTVVPSRAHGRAGFAAEADAAFDLFVASGAVHGGNAFLKWSYFFSEARDMVAIYPWMDIAANGPRDVPIIDVFDGYFGYDVYRMVTPAENRASAAVWVPVYFDAGNAGLMVSHNAPVVVGGAFRGMVGTDVLLSALSDRLLAPSMPDLGIVVVDQSGSVVADTDRVAATADRITPAADLLPAALDAIPLGRFVRHGDTYASAVKVAGTPWTAVTLVPAGVVLGDAAFGVLPYCLYLVLLAATLGLAFAAIGRRFVAPAIGLVATIESQARGERAEVAAVPPAWKPWIDRVLALFAEQRATLDSLHRAESKSAAVIDVALDAVVTTDAAGRVVDFNPAAEAMFGIPRADAVGKPIGGLIVPHALREAHEAGMARFGRTRQSHVLGRRVELQALHASGRIFPVELQIHALAGAGDVAYAAYVRDLTEQRAVAAALADQREKLHQAEKLTAMGSLLAGLAHELNNPLAIVTAQTSLLEELASDPPIRARATKIRAAADRCGRIVRTFLAMARKQAPQRSSVDVRAIVTAALDILAYGLRSNGVTVETRLPADLPAVEADSDQLGQVVINMVVNAQQAFGDRTGERRIWVSVGRGDGTVEIEIADNGPGIPEAVRGRIFEAFFTTKPVGVGTGIGLAVCRSIVEAHGGRIEAGERPGGGARFRILLPAATGTLAAPDAAAATAAASDGRRPVLVVDDEHEVAESLADFLELDGCAVTMAHSIADGLAAIAGRRFEVVFCDLRMPGGGGTAFWTEVARRDPALAERFVFVTGDMVAGPETLRGAAAGRPVRILEKPFDRPAIRALLAEVADAGAPS
ncbi:ATP-binding protein [Oharaeibacter diazotrophicus]|uniref:histidine kinase n=4 Tax=Oharaeibacter diazotrophicus TaxID=1920512 RepID=A0A4R6R6M2_9HYPH|nr:ATP-binding protein [Oharaeibacter diazotrophicus]TDP81187.1 PAS domain S-box-containing protein [Oharaeibacter diazotrophicus]BBE74819.1 sensor protein FixL [Pleomorphomonas sp. SM30]GLS75677.1 hypothetical protein GCM10007904_10120 [Oharaeibacter diazotrophicus]